MDLMKVKARLGQKQAELQAHIHALRGEHEESAQFAAAGEASQTFEEVAVDLLTTQKRHSVLANEILLLTEVHFALQRLAEGTYGFCALCGQPIPEKRLEALPWAALCIKDQQQLEQKLHSYA